MYIINFFQGGIGFFDNSNNTWVYSINEKTWHLQPVQGKDHKMFIHCISFE